jgi:hypothetical protein
MLLLLKVKKFQTIPLFLNHAKKMLRNSGPGKMRTGTRLAFLCFAFYVLFWVTPKGRTSTGGSARPVTSTLGLSKLSGPTEV